jgi:hypothetical protein
MIRTFKRYCSPKRSAPHELRSTPWSSTQGAHQEDAESRDRAEIIAAVVVLGLVLSFIAVPGLIAPLDDLVAVAAAISDAAPRATYTDAHPSTTTVRGRHPAIACDECKTISRQRPEIFE